MAPAAAYQYAVMEVLPYMPTTRSVDDVAAFIRAKKQPAYFEIEGTVNG
ncbi:MAG TPA: hypothetical protein PLZ53_08030 [Candidatus Hydrogenedentes bacterium]|nr:hypothetical protein [Candidatus Hydrogenedentota bacterium]